MLAIACYAIALTAAAWALWVRRGAWRVPWERPTSSAIAQLAVALVLIAPATEPVLGRLGFELTGRWHVHDYVGHMLELGALVSSNLAGMMRMPSMRHRIGPLLWHPLVVGSAVLMMVFWQTTASHSPIHDMLQMPAPRNWMNAYFSVLIGLLLYYGGLNAWVALAHLRGDPRAKPVALTWLVCVGLGGVSVVGFALPWLGIVGWMDWCRMAMCVATATFAVESARSWQRKLGPYRKLIQATGARL